MSQTPSGANMDVLIYHNNQFYDKNTPLISPLDLSVIRGYAICDTFRTYNKTPFLLERHIDRFMTGAKTFSLPLPYSKAQITTLIHEMLERAHFSTDEIVGKLLITPGVTPDTYATTELTPQFFIILNPLTPFPETCYRQGVHLKTIPYTRPMPGTKHTSYHCPLKTLFHLANPNIHDTLYIDENNKLLEAGTSNFFLIDHEGSLCTAGDKQVLNGITREFILDLAASHGFTLKLEAADYHDLAAAQGAFITSCNRGIMPVAQIDDVILPHPSSCETLQKLQSLMNDFIIKNYFYNSVDV